jgi:ferritin-like metal-binding protein YciE
MSGISNARDLFFAQLAELLWIERILEFEALPKLRDGAHDAELRDAFARHLEETRSHVARVEQAFRAAGAEPASARSKVFESLKEEHDEQAEEVKEPTLRDLLHATGAAQAEHLELAIYDALSALGGTLGFDDAAKLLAENRRDEEHALEVLEKLAAKLRGLLPR